MLETLVTSKTRLKLLLKFFLNSNSSSYLRELESEFNESTNAIRLELNRFEDAGLLTSQSKGNKKIYRANTSHPLYSDINNILLKNIGFDKIIENVIHKLGKLNCVYIVGEFARGVDNHVIDLVFVCDDIDREYLARLTAKAEKLIKRKIKYLIMTGEEFDDYKISLTMDQVLLLWSE
ncbi:ArsR family transcriptional regulator [Bacteroidota bacterium]